jgi:hypothetical protein
MLKIIGLNYFIEKSEKHAVIKTSILNNNSWVPTHSG